MARPPTRASLHNRLFLGLGMLCLVLSASAFSVTSLEAAGSEGALAQAPTTDRAGGEEGSDDPFHVSDESLAGGGYASSSSSVKL